MESTILAMKTRNYKIDIFVGPNGNSAIALRATLDTDAGPNIISSWNLPPEWIRLAKPVKAPRLFTASKHRLPVIGLLPLTTRIGELRVRVEFLLVESMATDCILGTTFIDQHVRAIVPPSRKVVLDEAPAVAIVGETGNGKKSHSTPQRLDYVNLP